VKHVFRFFLFLGIPLVLGVGCSSSFEASPDGTYRVRIPVNDSKGQYHFQTVTLRSVTNISSLAGSVLSIRINGKLVEEDKSDGTKQMWISDFGTVPAAHFIKSGDVLIPADYRTSVMATLVYQFENIKDFYDGYSANEGLLFPRTVLLDLSETGSLGNEAEYIGGLDMFVIQPYNQGLLPMSVNGGILAHEWWHSIFGVRQNESAKKIVRTEIKPDSKSLCANDLQYQGLNEGIADFFGYAYSHDPDYGSMSFKSTGKGERDLKIPKALAYDDGNCQMDKGADSKVIIHNLGASVAHMLFVISEDWGIEETSRAILNFTNFYMDLYTRDYDKSFIGFKKILPFLFENHHPSEELCAKLKTIVTISDPFSGYCKL